MNPEHEMMLCIAIDRIVSARKKSKSRYIVDQLHRAIALIDSAIHDDDEYITNKDDYKELMEELHG